MAKQPDITNLFKNNILIIGLVLLAFVAGSLWNRVQTLEKGKTDTTQTAGDQQAPARPTTMEIEKPNFSKDHWRGNKDAQFVLVQYSDFECPFCKTFDPTARQVLKDYGDKIALVYRHFPLSFHANAQKEHEASECIAEQGGNDGFWKFSDAIFERTTSNGTGFALTALGPLAKELGYDQKKFQSCLDTGKYEKKVKDQLAEGSKAGVAATPTSVLYNMKTGKNTVIEGALPFESVKQTIDTFIKG